MYLVMLLVFEDVTGTIDPLALRVKVPNTEEPLGALACTVLLTDVWEGVVLSSGGHSHWETKK